MIEGPPNSSKFRAGNALATDKFGQIAISDILTLLLILPLIGFLVFSPPLFLKDDSSQDPQEYLIGHTGPHESPVSVCQGMSDETLKKVTMIISPWLRRQV